MILIDDTDLKDVVRKTPKSRTQNLGMVRSFID